MSSKQQKISSSPNQKGNNEERIVDKIIQDLEGNLIFFKFFPQLFFFLFQY